MKTKSKRIEARVKPDTLVLVQRAAHEALIGPV